MKDINDKISASMERDLRTPLQKYLNQPVCYKGHQSLSDRLYDELYDCILARFDQSIYYQTKQNVPIHSK